MRNEEGKGRENNLWQTSEKWRLKDGGMQGGVRSDEPRLEKKELEGKEDGNPFSLLSVYLCVPELYF